MKTLLHADWLSRGWKQTLANERAHARPLASKSRFRPDFETNKRAQGAGGTLCRGAALVLLTGVTA